MPIRLDDGGKVRLAVPAGRSVRGTALSRILALRREPGWIAGSSVREWRYEETLERDGTVYLVGPDMPGVTLEEVITGDPARALPLIARLAHALLQLSEGRAGWFPLQSDSIVFLDDGDVLFLPPAVDRELRELRPFEANRDTFESLAHPDLTGEAQEVFALAAALYRLFAGRFPFTGADAEELHAQARSLEVQPPALLVPGMDAAASELIMSGLRQGRRPGVSLSEMAAALDRWREHSPVGAVTEEERRSTTMAASARETAATRSFQRRRFWQRNWRVVAVVAVAVAVVGALGGTMLKNALAPRVTRGYAPEKVVQTFYLSMNTLDHTTMQACVIDRAGKDLINEVMTLYVTSRVTMGYEGRSNVMSAADWDAAGRPPLVPPSILFGVTGLVITQEMPAPAPVFLARYDLWTPAPRPDSDAPTVNATPPESEGQAITERVSLRKDHGDWVIWKIEGVSRTELPRPAIGPPPPERSPMLAPASP